MFDPIFNPNFSLLFICGAFAFILGPISLYQVKKDARRAREAGIDRLHQAGTDALQTVAAEIAAETKGGG